MKKTLIVTAHPSSLWFTHKIAESYKKSIEEIFGVKVLSHALNFYAKRLDEDQDDTKQQ